MFTFRRTPPTVNCPSLVTSQLYNQSTFYNSFYRDLQWAQELVIIESPFMTQRRVMPILPLLRQLKKRGVKIFVNTKPFDEHDSGMAEQAKWGVDTLQEIGVTVLMTSGHHRKVAIVDNVLYEGSLNILSQNDSCELMRRIQDEGSVRELLRFTGLEKWCK